MILVTQKLNRNSQIPTPRLDINFRSNTGLSNIYIISAILRYPYSNDNTSSVVNIRYSVTLIGITGFSLARTTCFLIINMRSSRSKALYTLKVIPRGSIESIYLINTNIYYSLFQYTLLQKKTLRYKNYRSEII